MEIQPLFLQLIFHMSQRFLVGPRLCRDQEWLAAMGEFADNLTCHRIVRDPAGITLHDGAHLACGTHLCLASHSISRDPANVRGPDAFDGLRYYRQRHESGADTMKHQHATADRNHLHFGYGRNSCPGRFVASCELKLLFAALLRGYEFAYPLGVAAPPRRKHVLEFPYLDPATSMMVRRRPQMT
ncbi:cytochrome P450 [Apiospora saccharicola]|uniref:Cytochrome P450 n=1 Tax=Apiospora saccharicola TaxID=335842 RepID=A0ABR1TNE3_9PEZI